MYFPAYAISALFSSIIAASLGTSSPKHDDRLTITFTPNNQSAVLSFALRNTEFDMDRVVCNLIGFNNGEYCAHVFTTGLPASFVEPHNRHLALSDKQFRKDMLDKFSWSSPRRRDIYKQSLTVLDLCKDSDSGHMRWNAVPKEHSVSLTVSGREWTFQQDRHNSSRESRTIPIHFQFDEKVVPKHTVGKKTTLNVAAVNMTLKNAKIHLRYGENVTASFTPRSEVAVLSFVIHNVYTNMNYDVVYNIVGHNGNFCALYFWTKKDSLSKDFSVPPEWNTIDFDDDSTEDEFTVMDKYSWVPESIQTGKKRLIGFLDHCRDSRDIKWNPLNVEYTISMVSRKMKWELLVEGPFKRKLLVIRLNTGDQHRTFNYTIAPGAGMSLQEVQIER